MVKILDYTQSSDLDDSIKRSSSLLNLFDFTDNIAFDQDFEGVAPTSFLPGAFAVSAGRDEGIEWSVDIPNGVGFLQSQNFVTGGSGTGWRLDTNGDLEASSGTFRGTIAATSGTIGGWTIGSNRLSAGSGSTTVGMDSTSSGGDDIRFFAGNATPGSAPFRVTEAGVLTATSGTIGGTTLGASTLTGGTIQTAASPNARMVMSGSGFDTFDSSNVLRTRLLADAFQISDSAGTVVTTMSSTVDDVFLLGSTVSIKVLADDFDVDVNQTVTIDGAAGLSFLSAASTTQTHTVASGATLQVQATAVVVDKQFAPTASVDLGGTASANRWAIGFINKIQGLGTANVMDLSLSGHIKFNQALEVPNATPGAATANSFRLFSEDLSAGNTQLSMYGEGTSVGSGTPTADGTIAVKINGAQVYLITSTSAT